MLASPSLCVISLKWALDVTPLLKRFISIDDWWLTIQCKVTILALNPFAILLLWLRLANTSIRLKVDHCFVFEKIKRNNNIKPGILLDSFQVIYNRKPIGSAVICIKVFVNTHVRRTIVIAFILSINMPYNKRIIIAAIKTNTLPIYYLQTWYDKFSRICEMICFFHILGLQIEWLIWITIFGKEDKK